MNICVFFVRSELRLGGHLCGCESASEAPWSESGRLVAVCFSSLKASTRAGLDRVKMAVATNPDGRHCAQNPAINASTGRCSTNQPAKASRGGDQWVASSAHNQRSHHVHRGYQARRCSGQRRCSGALAAQEEPGSTSHERQARRQEEPGVDGRRARRVPRTTRGGRAQNRRAGGQPPAARGRDRHAPRAAAGAAEIGAPTATAAAARRGWRRARQPHAHPARERGGHLAAGRPLTPSPPLTHPSPLLGRRFARR